MSYGVGKKEKGGGGGGGEGGKGGGGARIEWGSPRGGREMVSLRGWRGEEGFEVGKAYREDVAFRKTLKYFIYLFIF